jgi:hypothetical protein
MVKKYYNAELILSNGNIKEFKCMDINDVRLTLEHEIWANYQMKINISNDTIYNIIKRPQKTNIFIRQKIKVKINTDMESEDN